MAMPLLGLIIVVAAVALFVWWFLMLVEALRVPTHRWTATGHNQTLYVLGMFLVGFLGTLLYVLVPRKDLKV